MKRIALFFCVFLVACGGSGDSDKLAPVPVPKNVSANTDGDKVTVDWAPVDGVTQYNVYYAHEAFSNLGNYAAYEGGTLILDATPPLTFTADTPAAVYRIRVTAVQGQRESAGSSAAIAMRLWTTVRASRI